MVFYSDSIRFSKSGLPIFNFDVMAFVSVGKVRVRMQKIAERF